GHVVKKVSARKTGWNGADDLAPQSANGSLHLQVHDPELGFKLLCEARFGQINEVGIDLQDDVRDTRFDGRSQFLAVGKDGCGRVHTFRCREPCLVFQRVDLREGRCALQPEEQRIFHDGLETLFFGLLDDVQDGTVSAHQLPNRWARAEETVDGRTAYGADSVALGTAALLVNDLPGVECEIELGQQLLFVRFHLAAGLAGGAKHANQALGHDQPDQRLKLVAVPTETIE